MKPILLSLLLLTLAGLPAMAQTKIPVWMCITPFKGDPNDDLVKYKCYTRDAMEPIWIEQSSANQSSMWFGEVRIRCTVHADGSVSNPTVVVGESCGLLKTISLHTLVATAPFKPFSDALVKETGGSYVDEISFTVTSRKLLPASAADRVYDGENVDAKAPVD